ncbi:MAG: tRNA lysidine(34) synthetase TilS, partial [Oscillospiraceae bacterium]|nr:tRNA lysidine(34) synthetase TilS [Oscillospiraceae bacterium]
RCPGGTKLLKELFIDKKIPAAKRSRVPVLVDDAGILGVYGVGADQGRIADSLPAVQIVIESI